MDKPLDIIDIEQSFTGEFESVCRQSLRFKYEIDIIQIIYPLSLKENEWS